MQCRSLLQVSAMNGTTEYIGAVAQRCRALASVTHGGQIICDPPTLEGIQEQLTELHKGCNLYRPVPAKSQRT